MTTREACDILKRFMAGLDLVVDSIDGEKGRYVVAFFKTDREPSQELERMRRAGSYYHCRLEIAVDEYPTTKKPFDKVTVRFMT